MLKSRAKTKSEKRKTTRRNAQRLYSHLRVQYKKTGKKVPWHSVGYKDISGVGIGLLVNEAVPVDEKLDIALSLKDDPKPCHVKARVVWCRKEKYGTFKLGLEFEKTESDARLIEMLCEKIVDLSLDRRAE